MPDLPTRKTRVFKEMLTEALQEYLRIEVDSYNKPFDDGPYVKVTIFFDDEEITTYETYIPERKPYRD